MFPYTRRLLRSNHVFCFALLLASIPCALWAQDNESGEEDVFELSPFVVSQRDDRGYRSTNSTSGTSLDTQIRDLPMALEVINSELITDLHASNFKEALDYTAGVFLNTYENTSSANDGVNSRDRSPSSGASANNPFADTIVIRGYAVPNQQRMGFRVGSIVPAYGVVLGGFTDTANTERLEVVRGPQSLLYGINVLSGVVNLLPKLPLPENRTTVRLEYGNYDYLRGLVDQTGPLFADGSLNYRVVVAGGEDGDWTDHQLDTSFYGAMQLEWILNSKNRLFFEAQYGKSRREGGGRQFFTDSGNISDIYFENPYGENYTFGRDFFNDQLVLDPDFAPGNPGELVTDASGELLYGNTFLVEREGVNYAFPELGEGTRLSGSDVFREQKEFDFLILGYFEPIENLNLELGAYLTEVEVKERNVLMGTFNNSTGTITGSNIPLNPEAVAGAAWGYGIGELFTAPNPATTAAAGTAVNDLKYAYTSWYEKPTTALSLQLRARVAYTWENEWFAGRLPVKHTVSVGLSYIKDEISFVNGTVSASSSYSLRGSPSDNYAGSRLAEDPLELRNIFDYSVLSYDGSSLAIPGNLSSNRLNGIGNEDAIVQSGWIDADLWYKGQYAVYHGNFWNDRLTLIGGVRRDAYQVQEAEKLRIADQTYLTDRWQGSTFWPVIDELIGYGDAPYEWRDNLPDELNVVVEEAVSRLRENQPNGTVRKNFVEDQTYVTHTAGLSVRVMDPLSVFFLYSEGVFPNTGQRDGAYQAIDAEQTENMELGVKFDFLEGRLSGSISAFKIKRENAVWNWPYAPNPARWFGAPISPSSEGSTFSPDSVRGGENFIRYGVAEQYVVEAFEAAGLELPKVRGNYRAIDYNQWGVNVIGTRPNGDPSDPTNSYTYFFLDYEALEGVPGNPFKDAMERAIRDQSSIGDPINYYGSSDEVYSATQASTRQDAPNVLYEEEGVGFDAQIIFAPMPNWQVLLSYSQQKREVVGSGFQLAPGYQIDGDGSRVDDTIWTTEYDIWVYQLGIDNFENPRDPTTLKQSAVNGVDLSFVPQQSARLWSKYSFTAGPFEGFSIGGGVRWNSSIPTTAGVGGEELAINRFPTPDVPPRSVVDLLFSYRHDWIGHDWTISLKINNLLNDDEVNEVVSYETDNGVIERRTRLRYEPLNFRLSLETRF